MTDFKVTVSFKDINGKRKKVTCTEEVIVIWNESTDNDCIKNMKTAANCSNNFLFGAAARVANLASKQIDACEKIPKEVEPHD
jgi:hypothetical protein